MPRTIAHMSRRTRQYIVTSVAIGGMVGAAALAVSVSSSGRPRPITVVPAASSQSPSLGSANQPQESSASGTAASSLNVGYYSNEPDLLPRYVLQVAKSGSGYGGWIFFVYQDGRTSPVLHYSATVSSNGAFTIHTDQARQPFGIGVPPPFPEAGTGMVPPGNTYSGKAEHPTASSSSPGSSSSASTITLNSCGNYLYWARPGSPVDESCTFSFSGDSF